MRNTARLAARPRKIPVARQLTGLSRLELAHGRDGLLYAPELKGGGSYSGLIVGLHGAGAGPQDGISFWMPHADEARMLILAPASRESTWDMIASDFGPDVDFIDEALEFAFENYDINREKIVLSGFSDGASYALSLGLANGDLFTHIVAFSPGFVRAPEQVGAPRVFVSHGTDDTVLPIEACSRRLVPKLQAAGYFVHYREFSGGHTVPLEVSREALLWLHGELSS